MEIKSVAYTKIPTAGGYIVPDPTRGSAGSAGCDLHAALDTAITIDPGQRAMVPLGIATAIPHGYFGLLCARSGLGTKHGITLANAVGIIDEDYRGQWQACFVNTSTEPYTIQPGDRVCQVLILPYVGSVFVAKETLPTSMRGEGGFGSTGK